MSYDRNYAIELSNSDASFLVISIFVVLGIFLVIGIIAIINNQAKQNSKPINRTVATVIEKTLYHNMSEWCIVQFDNGERIRLRNPDPNKIFVSEGDKGYIEYQGQIIISFERIS